jgi:hypothetical protein
VGLVMVTGLGGAHGPGRHSQPDAGHNAPAHGIVAPVRIGEGPSR